MSIQTPILHILIVKLSSLGDVIHGIPIAYHLKRILPECKIAWMVHKPLGEILRLFPCVDEVIEFDRNYYKKAKGIRDIWAPIFDMIHRLKSHQFDWVIDLQGLLRSGFWSYVSGAKLRIGFKHAREGAHFFYHVRVNIDSPMHALDQNFEILKHLFPAEKHFDLNIPLNDRCETIFRELASKYPENIESGKYVLICPGTRWHSKQWPWVYFKELIEMLASVKPVVVAGTLEDSIALEKAGLCHTPNVLNVCGQTTVSELVTLVKYAGIVIANDSGPMHLAALFKVKLLALLGPTAKWKTGPYQHGLVLQKAFECVPCLKKECHLKNEEHKKCLTSICPAEVFNEVKRIIHE